MTIPRILTLVIALSGGLTACAGTPELLIDPTVAICPATATNPRGNKLLFKFAMFECPEERISYTDCSQYGVRVHTVRACERKDAIAEVQQTYCGPVTGGTFKLITAEPQNMLYTSSLTTLEEALVGIYDEGGPNRRAAGQPVIYVCGRQYLPSRRAILQQ